MTEHIGKLGLNNLGNTCYLNSCLQLLSHSGKFVKNIITEVTKNKDNFNSIEKNMYELLIHKWLKKTDIFNPINLQKDIAKRNPIFNIGPQNDSSESMIFLFDLFENKNFINVFENTFESCRTCKKCNNISKSIEKFNIISLDISPSIKDSFNDFQKKEIVDGLVFCNKCNNKEEYYKQYTIKKLSDTLIIHMKRFSRNGNKFTKNNQKINIQENLILNNTEYDLRGIIIHSGRINGGHYYFIGKNLINQWFIYNDISCYKKNINLLDFQSLGYIFLYEKI